MFMFFQAHNETKKVMNKLFKAKGYKLKEKRFVLDTVLGYVPKLTDMTIAEMKEVIDYLNKEGENQNENI